jgi:peptidoglycan/xylan/chitin deacetylase (PgdA/CDA1 family)
MKNLKLIKDYSINIVTYHYVRPIKNSNYPNIKGLELEDFKKQVDYFYNNYNIIDDKDLIEIIESKKIPKKPNFLLTFDDGYLDHYDYVFPYFLKKKIRGIFYPPKKVIENKTVLDVNKIHFILEKEQNRKKILTEIDNILFKLKNFKIKDLDLKKINLKAAYDDKDTVLIKRLLQYFLPKNERKIIIDELFSKIINHDTELFAKKLYINLNIVKEMNSEKMAFGSHGAEHYWWEHLTKENQKKDMAESLDYFNLLGLDLSKMSVCYPYGSYNSKTLDLVKDFNFSFGLTTNFGNVNNSNINKKYELNRFDINELSL